MNLNKNAKGIFTRRTVSWNTAVQFAGKSFLGVCTVFLVGFLTRHFGADGFGELTTLFAWITTLIVLADMGLYITGVRILSVKGDEALEIVGSLFSVRLMISLTAAAAAALLLYFIPYCHGQKEIILLSLPCVILISGARAFKSWFQSKLIMHLSVAGEFIGYGVMVCLTVIAVSAGSGIRGVAWAFFAACLAYFSTILFFSKLGGVLKIGFNREIMWRLIEEALPLGLSSFMAILYFRFDMLMLSWMKPACDVGIYGAAYTIVEISAVLPALFLGSMLPIFSKLMTTGNTEGLKLQFRKSFDFLALIALPFLGGGLLLAAPLMELITGSNFHASDLFMTGAGPPYHVFQILVGVCFLIFFGQLNGHLLVAGGRQKLLLKIYFFLLPANIILNLILIPPLSYNGAALATLLSEVIAITLTVTIISKEYGLRPKFDFAAKAFISAMIMVLTLSLLHFHVIILVIIGVLVYFLILLSFFKPDLLKTIKNKNC